MENCICPECVSACRNDPGRLVPDDVRKLSRLLGISERDLENDYLVRVSVASGGHYPARAGARKEKGSSIRRCTGHRCTRLLREGRRAVHIS